MTSAVANHRLATWFFRWRSPLCRFLVRRVGVPSADVDDIAQEVFLRLIRYNTAELVEHPQAYLYRVASNVASEWSARASHRHLHDQKWLAQLVDDKGAEVPLMLAQSHTEVKRALAKLTARQQQSLRMFFAEGLSYRQIAQRSGQSLRTVRRQFERSYHRLRDELNPEVLEMITHGHD